MFTPFGEQQKNFMLKKYHLGKKYKKLKKKLTILTPVFNLKKYYQKKIGLKILTRFGSEEQIATKTTIFIKERIKDYSNGRNFPNILGTSKLSPFIKFGQIMLRQYGRNVLKISQKIMEHQNS